MHHRELGKEIHCLQEGHTLKAWRRKEPSSRSFNPRSNPQWRLPEGLQGAEDKGWGLEAAGSVHPTLPPRPPGPPLLPELFQHQGLPLCGLGSAAPSPACHPPSCPVLQARKALSAEAPSCPDLGGPVSIREGPRPDATGGSSQGLWVQSGLSLLRV